MNLFGLFKTPSLSELASVLEASISHGSQLDGIWKGRTAAIVLVEGGGIALKLSCQADLWCRKRTSVTTMLDPSLFEIYTTGDERIDADWIVQTNPPSAFKRDQVAGCDALLELLGIDPKLHATRQWLNLTAPRPLDAETAKRLFANLEVVARTAERELRI